MYSIVLTYFSFGYIDFGKDRFCLINNKIILKELWKLAVSTREISSTKKETKVTFLQDLMCWTLRIRYSVFTTVPLDRLISYILNGGADRFTPSCRASG